MEANQILLTPVSLNDLLSQIKVIVAGAVKEHQAAELKQVLLSPAETCKLFNPTISKVTLHEWTKQGLIPSYRMGGRIYYNYGEVIESAKRIRKFDRDKQVA
jgi:hypothetical protein